MSNKKIDWTFLTNHAHVLLLISKYPDLKVKEIADNVNITERAVLKIISELKEEGYVLIEKKGRRNRYKVCKEKYLKHPVEKNNQLSTLLEILKNIDIFENPKGIIWMLI